MKLSVTTEVWLVVTFATAPVDDERLLEFLRLVRPGSPGWNRLYRRYGLTPSPFLREALVLWAIGLVSLFTLNFGIGSLLLQRFAMGGGLLAVALLSGSVLLFLVRRQVRGPSGPSSGS